MKLSGLRILGDSQDTARMLYLENLSEYVVFDEFGSDIPIGQIKDIKHSYERDSVDEVFIFVSTALLFPNLSKLLAHISEEEFEFTYQGIENRSDFRNRVIQLSTLELLYFDLTRHQRAVTSRGLFFCPPPVIAPSCLSPNLVANLNRYLDVVQSEVEEYLLEPIIGPRKYFEFLGLDITKYEHWNHIQRFCYKANGPTLYFSAVTSKIIATHLRILSKEIESDSKAQADMLI